MQKVRTTSLLLIMLLASLLQVSPALAQSSSSDGSDKKKVEVIRKVLDNGLEVLIVPRPGTGVAIADVWVGVGSINETPANNGVAHFFEHMVFKGTDTRPVGSIDLEVDGMGGTNNASTSYDWTHYYIEAPSPKIDEALDILADMTYNAGFPEEEITREKEVVLRERDMARKQSAVLSLQPVTRLFYQIPSLWYAHHRHSGRTGSPATEGLSGVA